MDNFSERLEQELDQVEMLPTLPSVVLALEQALYDEKTSAEDVAQIMAQDPSLTAKVLQVANSAYYGSVSGEITSVSHAVARLGFREVSRVFTSLAVIQTFANVGEHFDHRQFWKHSLTTAIATRLLKAASPDKHAFNEEEAYVAGILHDIGALMFDQLFPDILRQIHTVADEKAVPYAQAEMVVLKVDHGDVGAALLERWQLPKPIIDAVRYHHRPGMAPPEHRALAEDVHIADAICTSMGIGEGGDGIGKGFNDGAWHDLGMSSDEIPSLVEKIIEETSRCETFLSLAD
jgi:putative nucleotidyltransferase with HDIG domain